MSYIIKVTVIWLVFLLLYELLYRNSARFLVNRIYLLASIVLGLVIPLLSLPGSFKRMPGLNNIAMANTERLTNVVTETTTGGAVTSLNVTMMLYWTYGVVAGVLILFSLRDVVIILRRAVYGRYELHKGYKLFTVQQKVAPYSFMGWIFLSSNASYTNQELNYIIDHEAAHNNRRHWMDVLLMQLLCIALWFHPLIWRYRYLVKLQHEYEADHIASGEDNYSYGHFLIKQTLLKGVPSIAHSFHFSPIKNRIAMLTKNHSLSLRKYLLIVPIMVLCVLVTAKTNGQGSRKKVGNITTYHDNTFEWKEYPSDTITVVDPMTGKESMVVQSKDPSIVKMNGDAVIDNGEASVNAEFRNENLNFSEYLRKHFLAAIGDKRDSVAELRVFNIVINKQGRIIYYDVLFGNKSLATPKYEYHPKLTPIIEGIIADSPNWLPASKNGEVYNAYLGSGFGFRWQDSGPLKGKSVGTIKSK